MPPSRAPTYGPGQVTNSHAPTPASCAADRPCGWETGFPSSSTRRPRAARPSQYITEGEFSNYQNGSLYWRFAPGIVYKVNGHLKTALQVGYDDNFQRTDYAGTATSPDGPVYLVGRLRQQVLSPMLRVNLNISPTLSLSYYGGPFATIGRYDDLRAVTAPRAAHEAERFTRVALTPGASGGLEGTLGTTRLRVDNPDFDWREFKSNLVLRWEYRPGSTLTCVWSQYRSDVTAEDAFTLGSQSRALFSSHPDNTLLVKMNYWFSL